jgi:paraquat-inducible protein B
MTSSRGKTLVGAFVLTGILLFVAGLALLGGRRFFQFDTEYVLYFDGSVSGLSIGSPVVFRGVPMGSVTRIMLVPEANEKGNDLTVAIPVYIQIDAKHLLKDDGTQEISEETEQQIIRRMVQNSMHARLQLQSIITGQYRIELDFFPGTAQKFRSSTPELEIPTLPSPMEALQRALNKVPLERVVQSLDAIMGNFALALADGKLNDGIKAFSDTFSLTREILQNEETRRSIVLMVKQVSDVAQAVGTLTPEAIAAFRDAMETMADAAEQARRVAVAAQDILGRDSASMVELHRLLYESTAAVRALREFATMLERNPEILLQGRKGR